MLWTLAGQAARPTARECAGRAGKGALSNVLSFEPKSTKISINLTPVSRVETIILLRRINSQHQTTTKFATNFSQFCRHVMLSPAGSRSGPPDRFSHLLLGELLRGLPHAFDFSRAGGPLAGRPTAMQTGLWHCALR